MPRPLGDSFQTRGVLEAIGRTKEAVPLETQTRLKKPTAGEAGGQAEALTIAACCLSAHARKGSAARRALRLMATLRVYGDSELVPSGTPAGADGSI